jgi:hypothetical protein
MKFFSDSDSTKLTSKTSKRLAYIDFKLFFTGHISRTDLKEVFGIAEAAASRALTEYSTLRPENKIPKTNTIIRGDFRPLMEFDAEQALGMLAGGFNSNMRFNESEVTYEKIGKIPNQLNIHEVAMITRAIFGKYSISCNYLSEHSGNHEKRTLVPLAIMCDGTSWMFRAFDRSQKSAHKFKNFHFARVRNVDEQFDTPETKQKDSESLSHDKLWNLRLPLILRLHDSLSGKDCARIRTDFGMNENELYITERAAFRWIVEKKWFIDCRTDEQIKDDTKKGKQPFFKFRLSNLDMVIQMESA